MTDLPTDAIEACIDGDHVPYVPPFDDDKIAPLARQQLAALQETIRKQEHDLDGMKEIQKINLDEILRLENISAHELAEHLGNALYSANWRTREYAIVAFGQYERAYPEHARDVDEMVNQ